MNFVKVRLKKSSQRIYGPLQLIVLTTEVSSYMGGQGSMQCDEGPPAAFNQKSNVQTRTCIHWYQNSGTQAPLLGQLVRNCELQRGDKVLVQIEGGCPGFPLKRSLREIVHVTSTNATLHNPAGDGSFTYIALDLGELDSGHYDLDVSLDGHVDNITILDVNGDSYARLVSL
ncbi:hypothetical protein ACMFMG_011817 [Clarireedia jacksonii]